jgi:aromatic ring-cleaving dioxygenase
MSELSEPRITGYHAHIYFNAATLAQAQALCEKAAERFSLTMGRIHQRPVGPHPDWSCQLAFAPSLFGEVVPWLALHRAGLVVFIHPITDDDLLDHSDHAIWMGEMRPLKLSIFSGVGETSEM